MIINGRKYRSFGDPAYCLRVYLIASLDDDSLGSEQKWLNTFMARVRTTMEWGLQDIKSYVTPVDFPRQMTISKVPVGKLFVVSTIRWYFRVCSYGLKRVSFFDMYPRTIQQ